MSIGSHCLWPLSTGQERMLSSASPFTTTSSSSSSSICTNNAFQFLNITFWIMLQVRRFHIQLAASVLSDSPSFPNKTSIVPKVSLTKRIILAHNFPKKQQLALRFLFVIKTRYSVFVGGPQRFWWVDCVIVWLNRATCFPVFSLCARCSFSFMIHDKTRNLFILWG